MYYLRKFIGHLSSWLEYLREHIIRLSFILIIFIFACIFFCSLPKYNILENNVISEQHIVFQGIILENWFTYISLIAIFITAIWAIYQFNKSTARKQQERASEIAQEFANNLVEKMAIIPYALLNDNAKMKEMINKIVNSKPRSFDAIEICKIVADEQCFQICNELINSKETQNLYLNRLSEIYNTEEQKKFNSYFPLLVENTLNQLEAICISISSQAAGSEFIYNSLHQSFLYFVEVMAIKIATNNTNNVDKHYTHIIQVYNMWNSQKERDIAKFKKTQQKIQKLQKKSEKAIAKLLEKKNKTV